jgi:aminopeptidase N
VTCDDFLAAMADANGVDLSGFARWYAQSGTPVVRVSDEYDAATHSYTLVIEQHTPPTPDQQEKLPLVLPLALGLLDVGGTELPVRLGGEAGTLPGTRLLVVDEARQAFTFHGLAAKPVPSLFRDFSAPVKVSYDYTAQQLATLIAHDSDAYVRWDAAQHMALTAILEQCKRHAQGLEMTLDPPLLKAFAGVLDDTGADPALLAEALKLPDEEYVADHMEVVDVDGIHAAREFIKQSLAQALEPRLSQRYSELDDREPYRKTAVAMARRSLKNTCLSYLLHTPGGEALAVAQLETSDNMTDYLAAIQGLVWHDSPLAADALAAFEARWGNDALVMDKWFSMQAVVPGGETLCTVQKLMEHPAFSIKNPNKIRALISVFAMLNPTGFHAADGAGYAFVAERVKELDGLNPQVAARLAAAFNRWKRYDEGRRALMQGALERIAEKQGLSADVAEIVNNALQ